MGRFLLPILCVALVASFPSQALARSLAAPLPLMLVLRARGDVRPEWDWLLPDIAGESVGLTIRFREAPPAELVDDLAEEGIRLRRTAGGDLLHIGQIYSALVPWDAVPRLAAHPEVDRVELARPPACQAHLDVSVPEIRAPAAWAREDPSGSTLDGTGVLAADFDSGVDVFHPLLFQADGGTYDWLDVDGDGRFEPGLDVVDLDGDGAADPGEALLLLEGALEQGGTGWTDGLYDPDVDWLFNDTDGDGERAYGPEAGFTDLDPSFGEPLFISLDTNGNGRLDIGEPLVALGTSKLVATLVAPDRIRHRGVDLIETPVVDPAYERRYGVDDRTDHGTGVSSVLVGGWSGSGRRLTGVAPGAELVLVDFNNDLGLAATLPWVISLGALVGSHPYGHKLFSFLDGSSNDELAIDLAYEEHGALEVVSVGNEAGNRDDASAEVPPAGEGPLAMPFTVTSYDWSPQQISLVAITLRWRRPEAMLSFSLVDPEGNEVSLGAGNGSERIGGATVDHSREDSPRGTAKADLIISRSTGSLNPGEWTILVEGDGDEAVNLLATIMNDLFRGGMGTSWSDPAQVDAMATVSAYATADRAIGACSYGTRQSRSDEVLGEISDFSSRGPRIDGARIVDVCAPGDNDIIWAQSSRNDFPLGAYSFGGGTSASAPHVAGAIALLRQAAPWATAPDLEDALLGGALADELVGEAPNDTWGFGKVRVDSSLALLPVGDASSDDDVDLRPWEGGLTPDAGAPAEGAPPPLVGVEGGGCHCRTASPNPRAAACTVLRRLESQLLR